MYPALKLIHVGCAVLSISGFTLRGVWMWRASPLLRHPLTRVLPHVIDTLFLVSGIALAVTLHQYPFVADWLTAKVLGLVVYIVLGSIALRHGRTRRARTLAMLLALLTFAYIASVAHTHDPRGFLAAVGMT